MYSKVYEIVRHARRLKYPEGVELLNLNIDTASFPCLEFAYSLAFVCALFNIGSIFVAFITSPLTLSLPAMNSLCAFALPLVNLPKSSSESDSVTA